MKRGEEANYDFDTAVPGRAAEGFFAHEIPVHTKDFSRMFLPLCNGVGIYPCVEELDGAVARCCDQLV